MDISRTGGGVRGWWLVPACWGSLGLFFGCASDRYEPAIDLVAGLVTAEITGDSDLVRTIGDGERGRGWRVDELGVFGVGDRSVLDLRLEQPVPLAMEFRCAPVASAGVESLFVVVNGNRAAAVSLEASPRELLLAVDGGWLRAGRNRIVFGYGGSRPIAEAEPAVAWEYIRFRPLGSLPTVLRDAGQAMLYLPYGSRVDYHLELRPGARLAASARHFVSGHPGAFTRASGGPARGGLEAELRVADEAPRPLGRLGSGGALELPLPAPALARLSLAATPPPAGGSGGVLLVEPRIEVPATAPGPAPASGAAQASASRPPSTPPNVLLYVIDTLRADRLGCYGGAQDVSPHIDALAAEALVFDRAIAQSSWTKAAMASVFTGLYPTAHGIQDPRHRLSDELWTLAEMLREAGYRTAGFFANGYLKESQGFAQGFETYVLSPQASPILHQEALAWLDEAAGRGPFFLFVHTIDPHGPLDPPEDYRRRFAPDVPAGAGTKEHLMSIDFGRVPVTPQLQSQLEALYDAEIAANDAQLGRLLAALVEQGVYDDTLIIFLSDHGEAFFEHGRYGHGNDLYDEVLRVPLILRLPGGKPVGRVAALAQQADLMPTLAAFLGLPLQRRLHGRNLLGEALGDSAAGDSAVHTEDRIAISHMDRTGGRSGRPRISLIQGDWKVIEPLNRPTPRIGVLLRGDLEAAPERELYHLGRDPGESRNLAAREPDLAWRLATLARARAIGLMAQRSARVEFTDEERRQLQALGYLQ